jgi:hypothetical protein
MFLATEKSLFVFKIILCRPVQWLWGQTRLKVTSADKNISRGSAFNLQRAAAEASLPREFRCAPAKTLHATCRIDSSTGLDWLRDRWISVPSQAGQSTSVPTSFESIHQIRLSGMRKTLFISLCGTDWLSRLSHLRVTPDQFVSVTVPRSFLSSPQQTRAPTLSPRD